MADSLAAKMPDNRFGGQNGSIGAGFFLTLFINMFLRETGVKFSCC